MIKIPAPKALRRLKLSGSLRPKTLAEKTAWRIRKARSLLPSDRKKTLARFAGERLKHSLNLRIGLAGNEFMLRKQHSPANLVIDLVLSASAPKWSPKSQTFNAWLAKNRKQLFDINSKLKAAGKPPIRPSELASLWDF